MKERKIRREHKAEQKKAAKKKKGKHSLSIRISCTSSSNILH